MLSKHLSTTASSLAAPSATVPKADAPGPVVVFEAIHSLRKMTLNRPKALNALDSEMIDLIEPQLKKWEESPLANVILFKGTGKSFCAGGDVAALTQNAADASSWKSGAEFFKKEYSTDAYIAKMTKPVVTIMQGNTLGGGVGLSVHAPFRIATESTMIAMPETALGLFTDVGASFFLSRLDGQLGIYLGLTGDRVRGAGAFLSGCASHYVPNDRLQALEARLSELEQNAKPEDVNSAIEEFSADVAELQEGLKGYTLVGPVRRAIDYVFAKETVEEMLVELEALKAGTSQATGRIILEKDPVGTDQLVQKWAKSTGDLIKKASPTSLKLTLLAIRQGKELNIDEAFKADLRIATACMNPIVHPDFVTGVKFILIDKKRFDVEAGVLPAWSPSTLPEVKLSHIKKVYFASPPPFDNPVVPLFPKPHPGKSYKTYPHANFSLPTELDIRSFVRGDHSGSGSVAPTTEEVVRMVSQRWNGKIGVAEKVREVVERKCKVEPQGWLTWPSGKQA